MNRIDDLLAAMTLEEKLGQLTMVSAHLTPLGPCLDRTSLAEIEAGRAGSVLNLWGVERTRDAQRRAVEGSRLGIPLLFGFDVLHGHRTIFPIPLAEAAAFDPALWEATARTAAEEAVSEGVALTFAPMLDVSRDPRWGRIAESPGEDPWLAAQFARAKVHGFQGAQGAPGAHRFGATAKHFVAYGAVTAGRDYAAIDISDRTLYDVYLPPFQAAVEAGVNAIMPAFVNLAGIPMSANRRLLQECVRRRWGFDGVIVSDYQAVAELVVQGVAADLAEAAALALHAGIDIDMVGGAYLAGMPEALARGLVDIELVDTAVRRVLSLKQRLALFDAPYVPEVNANRSPGTQARTLAREAARRSLVLLSNPAAVLPLSTSVTRIAVIGPHGDARDQMLGPWSGAGRARDTVSVLDGLRAALPHCDVGFMRGVDLDGDGLDDIRAARNACRHAQVIVLCVGEGVDMAGEGASRACPGLPGRQPALAEAVLDLGKPVIVLLFCGRPLSVTRLIERAAAVLVAWFPGSEAGHAIADVLVGRHNPSARLPVSWPRDVGQVPVFYAALPSGRPADPRNRYTSQYLDLPVEPLYCFGHGLSYTRFCYSHLRVRHTELRAGDALVADVAVRNDGPRDGEETVLLFTHDLVATLARPVLELKAMARVRLAAGEQRTVTLSVGVDALGFRDGDWRPLLEPGEFEVLVGPRADRAACLRTTVRVVAGS